MTLKSPVVREFPQPKHKILIVLGYSEMLAPTLSPEILAYLHRVGDYPRINDRIFPRSRIRLVIPCGGATRKRTAQEMTEAEVMRKILIPLLGGVVPIEIEQRSRTTSENIRNARRIILRRVLRPEEHELVVFCKSSYTLKVKFLFSQILPEYTVRIEAFDMGNDNLFRVLIGTIFDMCSEIFPPLGWLEQLLIRIKVRTA